MASRFDELPDETKLQILESMHLLPGWCNASGSNYRACLCLKREEKINSGREGVLGKTNINTKMQEFPADTDRMDIHDDELRPSGFARILDLIRRRDGVELKEDQFPPEHVFEDGTRSLWWSSHLGAAPLARRPSKIRKKWG